MKDDNSTQRMAEQARLIRSLMCYLPPPPDLTYRELDSIADPEKTVASTLQEREPAPGLSDVLQRLLTHKGERAADMMLSAISTEPLPLGWRNVILVDGQQSIVACRRSRSLFHLPSEPTIGTLVPPSLEASDFMPVAAKHGRRGAIAVTAVADMLIVAILDPLEGDTRGTLSLRWWALRDGQIVLGITPFVSGRHYANAQEAVVSPVPSPVVLCAIEDNRA